MPAKRRPTRTAQHQPQPTTIPPSDYDTDTAAITDSAAPSLLNPPPKRTNTELNFTVLRRHYPTIQRILSIAPFAVVYTFSGETQQWEKCGAEGTLFICQCSGDEQVGSRYIVVVLNRKSLENISVELVSADDVEIAEQYIILQTKDAEGADMIYGVWIFSGDDQAAVGASTKEIIAQTMVSCAMQAQNAREAAEERETTGEVERSNGYDCDQQEAGWGYGMDGTAQMQQQMSEEEAVSHQAGQQLDLLQLFGSQPAQAKQHDGGGGDWVPQGNGAFAQHTKFTPTPDTDFFRTSQSPAMPMQQPQQQQPPPSGRPQTQQSALLDLFKR